MDDLLLLRISWLRGEVPRDDPLTGCLLIEVKFKQHRHTCVPQLSAISMAFLSAANPTQVKLVEHPLPRSHSQ